jgi:para-nitrobenzyl esterase
MRISFAAAALAFALIPAMASAQTDAPAAPTTFNTTTSTVSDILANPDAKAVLVKDAPGLVTDQLSMAGSMTLTALQQYAPTLLTPAVLAQIDADFAKIPAK